MTQDNESVGDRIERGIASKNPSDVSFLVPFVKVAALGLSTLFGFQAVVFTAYVSIGDSLAIRMAESRVSTTWFATVLFWLPMLLLDVAGLTEGDA